MTCRQTADNWARPDVRHPEVNLRIGATVQHIDFAQEDVDVAIRHGEGCWPELYVTRLYREELFPGL